MKRKEWIQLALEKGKKAFYDRLPNAPHANKEFIEFLPKTNALDQEAFVLRIALYTSYIKGWTTEYLNQEFEY